VRLFRYEAFTIDGHDLSGAIEALNARDAVTRLSQRGMRSIFVVAIDEDSEQHSRARRESLRLGTRRSSVDEAHAADDYDSNDDSVDGSIGAMNTVAVPVVTESVEGHKAIRGEIITQSLDRSIDASIDKSIDLGINVDEIDPLDRTQLRHVSAPTATGDQVLALIDCLTIRKVSFYSALNALTSSPWPGRTGRLYAELRKSVESAGSVEDLLQSQRSAFGSVAVEFLRIGEQPTGFTRSLSAYLAFRKEQRLAGAFRPGSLLSARTRRFAITFACAQEISGDVVGSLRCASMEMPRRLRRRLAESVLRVQSGEDLGYALPTSTLFRPGFERHFVGMVQEGFKLSELPATLRLLAYS
jgi:type II secretory pathway component PulF